MPEINVNSNEVIIMLLWVMMTGGAIWILDNILKRFENVMEDGFKQQARNINRSIRVNIAIVVLCISVYVYFLYNGKAEDLHALRQSGIVGSLFWILSSIGKFLLHLLAYLVYWGYEKLGGDYSIPRPKATPDIFLGFSILASYFIIRRLFFKNVNPLVWAMIVVLIAAGATYLSQRANINLYDYIKDRTDRIQEVDTTAQTEEIVREDIPNDGIDDGGRTTYRPEDHIQGDCFYADTTDEFILLKVEGLISAINDFGAEEASNEPQQEDYPDNLPAYQQALVNHMQDIRNSVSFRAVQNNLNQLTRDRYINDCRVQLVIQKELCEYYVNYFERFCPENPIDIPMAN